MSNIVARRIEAFLEGEKLSYEAEVRSGNRQRLWRSDFRPQIDDIYNKLGGQLTGGITEIEVPAYPIVFEGKVIVGNDELAYNRYAAVCLRAPFYSDIEGLNVEAFLRYCRQFEVGCKKVGLIAGVWSNPVSNKHFGEASDPGDFFGNGSSGWKMLAFQHLLRDMLAKLDGYEVLHFSIYDQIMSGGKLLTVGELMKSPSGEHYASFVKYLRRRLGLPAVAAEKPV
ncbi:MULTISPECIES: hypothetical protein [unclassified Imperialibacter]|uniref:DUF7255 family protein n=1 Tax=unclassified Imperialibacter TaxID=2629706 RepID=UPI001258DC13|nr:MULTISPECIES: hypothetical protein [unclassified Imperialibacter]CAD5256745.1 hypothetical protein IMPERIA89_240016 [Imperialibacter sp. 89]CAD5271741.1 hypothetical protein IMPERIA75_390016 [Imperialibacter sp. 75]VVT19135.1 conserved hypothetical protein [Imperialibacter sp. EC-SDR9]